MDGMCGWNGVNECLDFMDSPDGYSWEWMNRIGSERESLSIIWMNCMDGMVWIRDYFVWTCPTGTGENGQIGSKRVSIVCTYD